MDEQEYQDKLKVRTQLSLADQFRVLEHEFGLLKQTLEGLQSQIQNHIDNVYHSVPQIK